MLRRIALLVISSILVTMLSVGVFSYITIRKSVSHSFDDHLKMASVLGRNIDYILESSITRLHDISVSGQVNFLDKDWEPERRALRTAYEYSIFSDGVFITDTQGTVVINHPHKMEGLVNLLGNPYVDRALQEKRTVISDIYTMPETAKKVIYALVPLIASDGRFIGLVGGEADPTSYAFTQMFKAKPLGGYTRIELVDRYGVIISSNVPERILTVSDHNRMLNILVTEKQPRVLTCHRCHEEGQRPSQRETDVLAFMPLSLAPWGIAIREPEDEVFAPVNGFKKFVAFMSIVYVVTALLLTFGITNSIVRPLKELTEAARRISRGDLGKQLTITRADEIGELTQSFEIMRGRLAELKEKETQYRDMLEEQVRDRTRELVLRKKQLNMLLEENMQSQEDERKRLARELHDETSQAIAALGMSIEIAGRALEKHSLTPAMVYELRQKVESLLDGISHIIKDLRPPVLDDLGLVPAVNWLLERHISKREMRYFLDTTDFAGTVLDRRVEMACFRVIQEALTNVVRHSHAKNVFVTLRAKPSHVVIEIADDGIGFDPERAMERAGIDSGFGLLGVRERIEQMEGTLQIKSGPGEGTELKIIIPLGRAVKEKAHNA